MKEKIKQYENLLKDITKANENWLKNKSATTEKKQPQQHPWKSRTVGNKYL